MVAALLLLVLLLVIIATVRAVRLDGYGTTAPPPTFERSPDPEPPLTPRLLP